MLYTPGPGYYVPNVSNTHINPQWKIGTASRDINNNNNTVSPGPGQYTTPYAFPNGPKYSIALKTNISKCNYSPGPGHYDPKYKDGNPKYSMRIKPTINNKNEHITPGPGNYDIRTDKSLQCPSYIFGNEKKQSTNISKSNAPGPGNYEYDTDILNITNPKFTFGKGNRTTTKRPLTPGPGQYEYKNYIGSEAPKISISSKPSSSHSKQHIPGPGHYSSPNYTSYKTKSPSYTIGSSKREGIYKHMESNPGPGQYTVNPCSTRTSMPSYKIGTGKRPPLNKVDPSIPGPGEYDVGECLGKRGPKYSIVGKNKCISKGNGVPGPGMYECRDVNKMKNPAWRIGKGKREDELRRKIKDGVPGPGMYEYGKCDKDDGPRIKFGTAKRGNGITNNDIPGPGHYHIPCSIVDVNDYTREMGKFDPKYRYI